MFPSLFESQRPRCGALYPTVARQTGISKLKKQYTKDYAHLEKFLSLLPSLFDDLVLVLLVVEFNIFQRSVRRKNRSPNHVTEFKFRIIAEVINEENKLLQTFSSNLWMST